MTLHKDTVILQSTDINELQSGLEWGDKKELAKFLGVHPNTVSAMFRYDERVNGWKIKRVFVAKINEFKKNLDAAKYRL